MERAFFISETYLKENSPLSAHTEVNELYPFMKGAEDTYIHEAIGTKLFDRLVESLNASPKNTTDNEKALLRKIRPALMWYICFDALQFLNVKIRNIGVVKQAGDNMQSAEQSEIIAMRKQCKDKGDHYCRIMQKWLCENSDLFPEYNCSGWNCSDLIPNRPVGTTCDLAFNKNDRLNGEVDTNYVRKWLM